MSSSRVIQFLQCGGGGITCYKIHQQKFQKRCPPLLITTRLHFTLLENFSSQLLPYFPFRIFFISFFSKYPPVIYSTIPAQYTAKSILIFTLQSSPLLFMHLLLFVHLPPFTHSLHDLFILPITSYFLTNSLAANSPILCETKSYAIFTFSSVQLLVFKPPCFPNCPLSYRNCHLYHVFH